jgi:protein O-mannosyl-transferase
MTSRIPAWAVLALGIALLAVYGGVWHNDFHYDDFHSIRDNPHLNQPGNLAAFFYNPLPGGGSGFAGAAALFSIDPQRGMYRPLLLVSYWANQGSGISYHIVNLIVHGLACLVLGVLIQTVGAGKQVAWAGAMLFALHPLQAEVVSYASARSESLAALFYLVALWGHIVACRQSKTRYFIVAALALAAGLLVKAVAVTMPAAAALWTLRQQGRRQYVWIAVYCGITLAYIVAVRQSWGVALGQPVRDYGTQMLTQAKACVYYLYLLVTPVKLSVEHGFYPSQDPFEPAVFFAFGLVLSLGFLLWRWRADPVALWTGWAVLSLVPTLVVPLNVLVNEHRLYLALAFLVPVAVRAWRTLGGTGGINLLAVLGILVLGGLAHQRGLVWRDTLVLWSDAVEKAPYMYRAQLHLGGVLEERGHLVEAVDTYRRAVAAAPDMAETHYNLGNALQGTGEGLEAIQAYQRALHLTPNFAPALLNLAGVYTSQRKWDKVDELLRQAEAIGIDAEKVQLRWGAYYKQRGQMAAAERALSRAIELNPFNPSARFNLANLLFEQARYPEAEHEYRQAIKADPDYRAAYINLGDMLLRQAAFAPALQLYGAGLRQMGQAAIFYFGIAQASQGLELYTEARENYRLCLQSTDLSPRLERAAQKRLAVLAGQTSKDQSK